MGPRPRGLGNACVLRGLGGALLSFNGAETARSRKSNATASRPISQEMLQWGRDRAVSEMRNRGDPSARGCGASMGPRPRGLGNTPGSTTGPGVMLASMGPRPRGLGNMGEVAKLKPFGPLQWGRDRAVSEIHSHWDCSTAIPGFNGAETARSRKSADANRTV